MKRVQLRRRHGLLVRAETQLHADQVNVRERAADRPGRRAAAQGFLAPLFQRRPGRAGDDSQISARGRCALSPGPR